MHPRSQTVTNSMHNHNKVYKYFQQRNADIHIVQEIQFHYELVANALAYKNKVYPLRVHQQ